MDRNSEFIERYSQLAGVSREEATTIADRVCRLFAIEFTEEINLDGYLDMGYLAEKQMKELGEAEDENARLRGQIDDIARERDEFDVQVKDLEFRIDEQNKRINELEAANGKNDN